MSAILQWWGAAAGGHGVVQGARFQARTEETPEGTDRGGRAERCATVQRLGSERLRGQREGIL